ncbi:MAG: hypothetical protein JW878_07950 [Methanomicrobia archaeon]|nr:hypothetical protein [Methanomicrobia archaeon]
MKKLVPTLLVATIVLSSCAALCTPASAATEAEIEQAIDDGLAWLADAQQENGSWNGSSWQIEEYDIGATGLALLKFIEYAKEHDVNPTDPEYTYSDNVNKGLEFLDSHLMTEPVPVGGYDGNSNGNMTYLDGFHRTYVTGIATMAYAANPNIPIHRRIWYRT